MAGTEDATHTNVTQTQRPGQPPQTGTNIWTEPQQFAVLRPDACKKESANTDPDASTPPASAASMQPHHVPGLATQALSSLQPSLRTCTLLLAMLLSFSHGELYFLLDADFRIWFSH